MFKTTPFLNGGLFECLDYRDEQAGKEIRIDGFSDTEKNQPKVPNYLFFSEEQTVDLNPDYGTRNKTYKIRGLIDLLQGYKFTITENTPIEEEIALDPELLGKIFENLLASYNPETGITARKQTGSFYTPREIVDYMVDESLIAYLETTLNSKGITDSANERLRHLLAYSEDKIHQFNEQETEILINAIDNCKILDSACGSGAFPLGILHKLVFILNKLDPLNEQWKNRQIAKAYEMDDLVAQEASIKSIEEAFEKNELDYGRKLYLIQNCIFGVDIQPIASQIAKLRFFISLIIDQKVDPQAENLGIRPLPNPETKFVAANTLIDIKESGQLLLKDERIKALETKLKKVRERYFNARTRVQKKHCEDQDRHLREEIGQLLLQSNFAPETTVKLATWNPYDQNRFADFFNADWMFGIHDGFDITIGNPPYPEFGIVTFLPTDEQRNLTYRAFFPEDTTSNQFSGPTITLQEICYISVGTVVNAHEKLAPGAFEMSDLVVEECDEIHPKPFVEGKHLDYWLPTINKWLEWGTERAPALFRRPTFPEIYNASKKILVQRSPGPDPKCCFDDKGLHFTESSVGFILWCDLSGVRNRSLKKVARYYNEKPRPDLPRREDLEETSKRFAVKYLLAVMNSTVAHNFLRAHRRSNIHLYPNDWKQLPIPDSSMEQQSQVIQKVDQILVKKRANPDADISDLEQQISLIVYKLYGLTYEEVKSVKPGFSLSAEEYNTYSI